MTVVASVDTRPLADVFLFAERAKEYARNALDKYADADETQLDPRYADVRQAHRQEHQRIHDGYVAAAAAMRSAIAQIDHLRAGP